MPCTLYWSSVMCYLSSLWEAGWGVETGPHPISFQTQAYLSPSISWDLLLVAGLASPEQLKSKSLVPLRIATKGMFPTDPSFFCLPCDTKCASSGEKLEVSHVLLSHGVKTQSGTSAGCLSFSSWFVLDVLSAWLDDVLFICCSLFFYLEVSLLCPRLYLLGTPASCL